jgi:hypothetical protein
MAQLIIRQDENMETLSYKVNTMMTELYASSGVTGPTGSVGPTGPTGPGA